MLNTVEPMFKEQHTPNTNKKKNIYTHFKGATKANIYKIIYIFLYIYIIQYCIKHIYICCLYTNFQQFTIYCLINNASQAKTYEENTKCNYIYIYKTKKHIYLNIYKYIHNICMCVC